MALTKKQETYCYYRARGENPTQSVLKSYDTKSDNMASVLGNRLEKKDKIEKGIQKERDKIFSKSKITEEYILEQLDKIASSSRRDADKVRALELLGKFLAMFKERQDITHRESILSEDQEREWKVLKALYDEEEHIEHR